MLWLDEVRICVNEIRSYNSIVQGKDFCLALDIRRTPSAERRTATRWESLSPQTSPCRSILLTIVTYLHETWRFVNKHALRAFAKALHATASADRVASSFRTLGPTPED